MTQAPTGPATWRETIEADPLGIATRRTWSPEPEELPSTSSPRHDVLRLLAAIVLVVGGGYLVGYGETVLLVLALVGCVVAHEFGHYLAAKSAGIKVTEFFVGFGPRLWSIRRGETEYGVKAIPLGGYCRIVGMNNLEEVDPADETRTYRQAKLWRRLTIDVAGSSMHFLIALVVLFAMFATVGDNGYYLPQPASNPIVEIDSLQVGKTIVASPAEQAGFLFGDHIVAIDGRHFATWDAMATFIQAHTGQQLDVTVDRAGQLIHLYPVPVNRNDYAIVGQGVAPAKAHKPVGFIGFGVSPVIHSSLGASVSEAGGAFVQTGATTFHALGHLVSLHGISSYLHMLTSQKAADSTKNSVRFESPVGVVRLLHQAGQSGLSSVLWLLALINIFIGIFNLLPIFPLDGGRVAVALYEGVRSRRRPYRVDMAKLLPVLYLGLALVLFIGATSLFLDLRDLAT